MATRCPNCKAVLGAGEVREGWCESCGKRLPAHFLAETGSPGRAEEPGGFPELESRSSRSVAAASREEMLGWGSLRSGLGHVALGALLIVIGFALIGGFDYLIDAEVTEGMKKPADFRGISALSLTGRYFAGFLIVIGCVLLGSGSLAASASPERSGTAGWAIGTLIVLILFWLVPVVEFAFQYENARPRGGKGVGLAVTDPPFNETVFKILYHTQEGLGVLGGLLFLIGMWSAARNLGSGTLAANILVYLLLALAFWIGMIVVLYMQLLPEYIGLHFTPRRDLFVGPPARLLAPFVFHGPPPTKAWITLGAVSFMVLWLSILLIALRGAISSRLSRS